MNDVMRKIQDVALESDVERVTRVRVRLGALSHFTPEHFREHFEEASRGTIAEGAEVDAVANGDIADEHASDVVIESVEVEVSERAAAC
jgi:hydrogenase nickel incorporation protein HypA/HybF